MRLPIPILILAVAALSNSQSLSERDPRYRLQPNDAIEVQYRYTPEYNQTVSVQPDGFISLQLIGDLKVSGLTLDQARVAIHERVSSRLRDPDLTIILKEYEKPHFFVGGEVKNPGRFDMRGNLTVLEAIVMAGGFNAQSAKHSEVILFRKVGVDTGEAKILNLKRTIETADRENDLVLRSGDMLLVPQNKISKIERFIKWANLGLYFNPLNL